VEKETYYTSLGCLHFLQVWSRFPKVRMIMQCE